MSDKIQVSSRNAGKFLDWLANRDGIAVWQNMAFDSAEFGHEVFQPVRDPDGQIYQCAQLAIPWKYGQQPQRIVTDIDEIEVSDPILMEVRKNKRGVEKVLAKYGTGAWYQYTDGDIGIYVDGPATPLREWAAHHAA